MDVVHKYKLTRDWEQRVVRIGVKRRTSVRATNVWIKTVVIPAYEDCLFFGFVKPRVADKEMRAISGCPWKLAV